MLLCKLFALTVACRAWTSVATESVSKTASVSDSLVSPEAVQRSFCNTMHGTEWGNGYDMGNIDFSTTCAFCAKTPICNFTDKSILSASASDSPLCCIVRSKCSCPIGMTQTSCTSNAIKNNIPIYNLFSDSDVVWVDAWQQFWSSRVSQLILTSSAFARVLTEMKHRATLREVMQAREALDDALGPFRAFPHLRDVDTLNGIVSKCEKFLEGTEKLKNVLGKLKLASSLYDTVTMSGVLTFCDKSNRWRDIKTGRYNVAPWKSKKMWGELADKIGKELNDDKDLEEELQRAVIDVLGMDEDLSDFWWSVKDAFVGGLGPIGKISMAVSGSRYIAKTVRSYSQKLSKLASTVVDLEKAAATFAKISGALNFLMMGVAIGDIAFGLYDDAENQCGCCAQEDSALINIGSSTKAQALFVRSESFKTVYPQFPWLALNVMDSSVQCSLQMDIPSHYDMLPRQELATRGALSQSASTHASDSDACFVAAYKNISRWAITEYAAEVESYNQISDYLWEIDGQVNALVQKIKKDRKRDNPGWCIFTCMWYAEQAAKDATYECNAMLRILEEADTQIEYAKRQYQHVKKAHKFVKVFYDMKKRLGNKASSFSEFQVDADCFQFLDQEEYNLFPQCSELRQPPTKRVHMKCLDEFDIEINLMEANRSDIDSNLQWIVLGIGCIISSALLSVVAWRRGFQVNAGDGASDWVYTSMDAPNAVE
mmetsp:Transcript_124581/g.338412  ORF Transcript_124581/g.338412 Transcript_124581/m.338412 type:complete len:713 (+) Transcript_124581:95-2233(+)